MTNLKDYKVSVIIPIYNTEPYLEKCLDSITNQTMKELQIICVNDGSTDNSLQILNEYAKRDTRIEIIDLKENVGGGKAKNIAIDYIKAPYFIIVDSDDSCALDMCEKAFNAVWEENGEGYEIGYFGHSVIDFTTRKILNKKTFTSHAPWGKIYKTSNIRNNKIKFYEGKGSHDNPFFVLTKIFCKRKNKVLKKERLYFYIKNVPNSIQTNVNKNLKNKFSIFNCYDFTIKFLGKSPNKKHIKYVKRFYLKAFQQVYKNTGYDAEIKEKIKEYFQKYDFKSVQKDISFKEKKIIRILGIKLTSIKYFENSIKIGFLTIPIKNK